MKIVKGSRETAVYLEEKLLDTLRTDNAQASNTTITLTAHEHDEKIVGGLVASTSYGWLLIKILWVDENQRRSGIGQSLISHAEAVARKHGCHGAWLDTSSSVARRFYEKSGYTTFGELQNNDDQSPPRHHRWFMRKSFNG